MEAALVPAPSEAPRAAPSLAARSRGGYRLLLATPIPVWPHGAGWAAPDLWVRDLEGQRRVVDELCVLAPLGAGEARGLRPVPDGIRVVPLPEVDAEPSLRALVRAFDVVQVGSGMPRHDARPMLRVARAAAETGRCLVTAVTSNRVRTTLLNAAGRGWATRARARLTARSIRGVQEQLVDAADGVMLIGPGLRGLVRRPGANVHVGLASWLTDEDVVGDEALAERARRAGASPGLALCVASRLERMKGVHLAIEATAILARQRPGGTRLTVLGEGPERPALEWLAATRGLQADVRFAGTLGYPEPFLRELRSHDLLLLTNLNDEQPRVVFDALSQGVPVVHPDSPPFASLGLDPRGRYRVGSAPSLADAVAAFEGPARTLAAMRESRELARTRTVHRMHEARAAWIRTTLERHRSAPRS